MRTLKKYTPKDDFDLPKQIDLTRDMAVLIRQSDHKAEEDHAFSREAQLKLTAYAQRLRNDATDEHVRVYDEGAGVSGQKRIDQRAELNRLYLDIKQGVVGSLVIMHEDRLFRDEYHTNDTTFIQVLAEHDVLLFVRTDHRRYDCTKPSDCNVLLEKMIASRNYLDDHVLGRMNSNQEAKALQGLYDGRSLPMGLVTQGKKKQQVILVYEPWARVVRWMFERFRELNSFSALCREINNMPYLFPDRSADDLLRYTFKIRMTKVQGGFKPTHVESIRYILTNPAYIGAWVYQDAIVREDNHPAIVDRELFMWAYSTITGRNLQGEYLDGAPPRRLRDAGAQAVLKYLLRDPQGPLYVSKPEHPEYVRQTLKTDPKRAGRLFRDITFAIRAHLIDDIYLERVKEIARGDTHLAQHIQASVTELQQKHIEAVISVDEHLAQVCKEQEKTLALLHDQILDLTPVEKAKYKAMLEGLREREKELLAVQEQSLHATLQSDLLELAEVLADVPAKLDDSSMERKQRLARLITESATIEELSVHWLRLTVVWRGPLADRPDACLIWRQRGRRSDPWTAEEDKYIKANYPTADKWTMLGALPRRSWNMIYQRALGLGAHRATYTQDDIPLNVCIEDLKVIPDPDLAMELVLEASKRQERSGKLDPEQGSSQMRAHPVWLYSADSSDMAREVEHRNMNLGS
jgi:recombinase/resolvase-like protein